MVLESDRLILRGWRDEDASSLFKYARDERVGPPAGWLPHRDENYSRAIIRTVFSKRESYAICLKAPVDAISRRGFLPSAGKNLTDAASEPVGSISLTLDGSSDRPLKEGEAELGYWVAYPFWGQGIASEAAMEICRYAFSALSINRIYCAYFEGNDRSKRVMEKCGFTYHHTNESRKILQLGISVREHVTSLSSDEWLAQRY
ncbi:MAG: GNAT family N-acetyltransferase [Butyrivibrio sp.]|nr:GNAT family N-acetyltransferase [Butyrivibrio sp.]